MVGCLLAIVTVILLQSGAADSLEGLERRPKRAGVEPTSQPETVSLREVSLDWNIAVAHEQSSETLSSLSETLGGGVCALDFDNDGWIDLFFVGGSGHTREYGRKSWWLESHGNRLLANKGGQRFEDVTERAHLDVTMWGMGCAVGDLDNDGFADLIVTGVNGNRVFRNRGDSSFEDITTRSGIVSDHWSTGASLADFNGDGLLDIYVSNYILYDRGARTFERSSGFRTAVDPAFDQTLYDAEPHRLYVNRGDLRFADVASEMGVADAAGRSLGARWIDLNRDHWPDLLVINDHDTPNQFYINEQGKHFALARGADTALEVAGSHDVAIADFDNDGRTELFMTRGRGRPSVVLSFSESAGQYSDSAWERGLTGARLLPFTGWAAVPADLNNDGFLDLYVANGLITPDADSRYVAQAQANCLFLNDQRGGFRLQLTSSNAPRPYSSRGAIAVDLDNDGQLELVVANNNDPFEIYAGTGSKNHWLVLDLHSAQRDAVSYGATITAQTTVSTITRTVGVAQHFLSQGDPRIHLGLGNSARVERLEIAWRDGSTTILHNLAADQFLTVDRKASSATPKHSAEPKLARLSAPAASRETTRPLLRVLLAAKAGAEDLEKLRTVWPIASSQDRTELLKTLPDALGAGHLALIREALRDTAPEVRRAAVDLLRRSELERSVAWLIPLLEDSDTQVQCAVADAFRFFFDEEEAVIERKTLAISPLIRLLASGPTPVRICAAGALASSENERAVLPLIELFQSAAEPNVKVAAARALGLIRDTRAILPLRALLEDAGADGAVVASSLVALSRLKDPTLTSLLERVLVPAARGPIDQSATKRYDALAYLLGEPDGLVVTRAELDGYLADLLSRAPPSPVAATGLNAAAAIAALGAISVSRSRLLTATVERFLASPDPEIRARALIALSSLDSPQARARLEARLLAEPIESIHALLPRLETRSLRASLAVSLFARPGGARPALEMIRTLQRRTASDALDKLLRGRRTTDEMRSLLEVCAESSLEVGSPTPAYDESAPLEVRAAYFACMLNAPPEADLRFARSSERLRTRSLLNTVLAKPNQAPEARLAILLSAARRDPVVARTWLAKEMDTMPVTYVPEALRAFQSTGTTDSISEYLWGLVRDDHSSDVLRTQAAEALGRTHRERIVEYVYSKVAAP
jgi:HEAT repeat protein